MTTEEARLFKTIILKCSKGHRIELSIDDDGKITGNLCTVEIEPLPEKVSVQPIIVLALSALA